MGQDILARIDRLESLDDIRQLVAKYSLSLDMRDLDAHVNLFAEDIRVSRELTGRAHLKRWLDDTLRLQFTGTSHHIGNHSNRQRGTYNQTVVPPTPTGEKDECVSQCEDADKYA